MKFNVLNDDGDNNIESLNLSLLEKNLYDAEPFLKEAMIASLKEIQNGNEAERKVIALWANYLTGLRDYYFEICDESNNRNFYKKVVKYLMFNK